MATSQSQESTQQPSIELKPAAVPFKPPFPTVVEVVNEVIVEEKNNRHETRLMEGEDGEGDVSMNHSSVEETAESSVRWTQTQTGQNGQAEGNERGADEPPKHQQVEEDGATQAQVLVPGSSATHRSSPDIPPPPSSAPPETTIGPTELAKRPTWVAAPPSRPSTPQTEGDQLDKSLERISEPAAEVEVDKGSETASDIPDPEPEPEPTEVDNEPPDVPTPENSQPALVTLRPSRTASNSTKNAPSLINKNTNSPALNLSPITRFTPPRNARLGLMGGKKRPASPTLERSSSTSGPSRANKKGRRTRSRAESIEDSFAGAPEKDRRKPIVRLSAILDTPIDSKSKEGTEEEDEMMEIDGDDDRDEDDGDDMEESQAREGSSTDNEDEGEEKKIECPEVRQKAQPNAAANGERGESEETEDSLNWDKSINRSTDQPNGESIPADDLSPITLPLADKSLTGRGPNKFKRFDSSSSTSPAQKRVESQLFSSQDHFQDIAMEADTEPSGYLQATQMVIRRSSPASSQGAAAHAVLTAFAGGLEPTQPDDEIATQEPATATLPDVTTTRTALGRIVSTASTTTSSKLDIPAHRQLQRRSRTEDDSPLIAPQTAQRNIALPILTPVVEPPSSEKLQASRSEPSLPQATTSSPRKSSPAPRSSSLPPEGEGAAYHNTLLDPSPPSQEEPVVAPPSKRKAARVILSQASSPPAATAISSPSRVPTAISSPPPTNLVSSPPPPDFAIKPNGGPQNSRQKPPAVLEPTLTHEISLPTPPPPKTTPTKQYKGPNSRRKQPATAAAPSPDPIRLSPRARKRYTPESEDSVSAPENDQGDSYRPAKAASKKGKGVVRPPGPAFKAENQKRARSTQTSRLTTPIDSDEDGSSSSAPEDPEDNTYQPSLFPKDSKEKAKTTVKPSDTASRTSSNATAPAPKKLKLTVNLSKKNGPSSRSETASLSTVPPANRVFAQWQQRYYSGTIVGQTGNDFKIAYDDGDEKNLPASKLRQLSLKKGDTLRKAVKSRLPDKFEVARDWNGDEKGIECSSNGESIGYIPVAYVSIPLAIVNERFDDRLVDPATLKDTPLLLAKPLLAPRSRQASTPRSPIKPNHRSPVKAMTNGNASRRASPFVRPASTGILKSLVFLITAATGSAAGAGAAGAADQAQMTVEQLIGIITENGGTAVQNWDDMFDLAPAGLISSAFKSVHARAGSGEGRRRPFLVSLGSKVILTPKFMVALAKGIPCLSLQFVLDSVEYKQVVDWRSYLISSGFSLHTNQEMSQTVDMNWGEESWDATLAAHLRRPMKEKKVLFVQPKGLKWTYLKTLAPVCLSALGCEELKIVPHSIAADEEGGVNDPKWDYILVEDRCSGGIPKVVEEDARVCNMTWLKQCLIMGKALPASLHIDK